MKRTLIVAALALPCLLALSYPWRHAHHGVGYTVSLIGWLGFLLALLSVLVASIALGVGRLRRPANSSAGPDL